MARTRNQILEALAAKAPIIVDESRQAAAADAARQTQAALAQTAPTDIESQTQAVSGALADAGAKADLAADQQGQQLAGKVAELDLQDQEQTGAAKLGQLERGARETGQAKDLAQAEALQQAEITQKKQLTGRELAQAERLQTLGIAYDAKASFLTLKQREDLAKLGGDVKQQIFDSRLMFDETEGRRKFTNERQLADWTAANARSQVELQSKMQELKQTSDKELIMLESAYKRLTQELTMESKDRQREVSQGARAQIAEAQAAIKRAIERNKAQAANTRSIFQGVGTIAGGVIGGIYGGPAGAMAGASIGGALGGAVGGVVANDQA